MSNVMSMKGLKNHASRSGFDLSRRNLFTAKAGELLPVMCEGLLPGDKGHINQQSFTRTRPVQTSAFTRMREYYDFYFVPNRLMWKSFDNFITGVNSPNFAKSLTDNSSTSPETHPWMYNTDVLSYLRALRDCGWTGEINITNTTNYDDCGLSKYKQSVKLLNYLGYGNFGEYIKDYLSTITTDHIPPTVGLNPFPLLAYQKVYQDFFRDTQWEKASPNTWNVDYLTEVGSSTVNKMDISSLTSKVKSSTKPFETLFDLKYCNWQKDYFTGVLPSAQYGDSATINLENNTGLSTVDLVLKNLTAYVNGKSDGWNNSNTDVSFLPTKFDTSNNTTSGGFAVGDRSNYPTDFKTLNSIAGKAVIGNLSSLSEFSVLALRRAEALQRRNEITQANDLDYKAQTEAHWNVNVPDVRSSRCTYLGGWVNNLSINEVVNQNLSSDSDSATIAGKGVGAGQGDINFEVKEHGILLCIYHCVPLLDWTSDGIRALNMKYRFEDYPIPEFDNIGMQLTPIIQLCNAPDMYRINAIESNPYLGYVPRYAEYKTAVDEVHGSFINTDKDWVAPVPSSYLVGMFNGRATNAIGWNGSLPYTFFKVNPKVLDSIFYFAAEKDGGSIEFDQFLINTYFDFKIVRNLDYNGLPY